MRLGLVIGFSRRAHDRHASELLITYTGFTAGWCHQRKLAADG